MPEQTFKESFKVAADQLVDALKKIVHEGNVRRIVIKQDGRSVVEFPMTVGVSARLVAPMLAAAGALAGCSPNARSKWNGRSLKCEV